MQISLPNRKHIRKYLRTMEKKEVQKFCDTVPFRRKNKDICYPDNDQKIRLKIETEKSFWT